MIRMIVSDLDKTLIGASGRLTDYTADVIRESQKAGVRWVLATGRGFETVDPVLTAGKVNMDLILLNGAQYISFDGKTQYCEALDPFLCRKLISFLLERKIDIELNTSAGNYATAPRVLDDSSDILPFASYREDTARVMKIFAFSKVTDRIEEAKRQLADNSKIRITSSAVWNMELNSPVVNKARMLKKLAMELDIAEDEIMVFGDGENDISLFQNFRHSRAVSNSVPEIRNLAERVIESCDHDGVAKEIMRIRSAWSGTGY